MENKSYSNCWYYEVCQLKNPCESCIRYSEMKYLIDHSGIPSSKQYPIPLEADAKDLNAYLKLNDFKNNIVDEVRRGANLLIYGGVGNGKTSWGIKILLKYFDEIWLGNGFRTRGIFIHIPTILLKLKDFENPISQEFKQNLLDADLVIWDELGGVGMSNYDYSQLLMYLDARISSEKANIFTSNLVLEEDYKEQLGERLFSRIYNLSTKIELKGKDRRKA